MLYVANSIVNGTIAFLKLRLLTVQLRYNMTFLDATGVGISVHDANGVIKAPMHSLINDN